MSFVGDDPALRVRLGRAMRRTSFLLLLACLGIALALGAGTLTSVLIVLALALAFGSLGWEISAWRRRSSA